MSNFAPVAPPELLSLLKKADLLGDYHLLLAHDVVARPDLYIEIFDGFEGTIIMDNSLIELGYPVTLDTMIEALEVVDSTYVVLPDHLGDVFKTIEASRNASTTWGAALHKKAKLMAVIQGNTITEIGWCIEEYKNMINIGAYAVPKIVGDTHGSRRDVISLCVQEGCVPIHLLGFSKSGEDDAHCAQMQQVMGIDSAVPLRLGLDGIRWSTQLVENSKRGDFWEKAAKLEEIPLHMHQNLLAAQACFKRS